MKLSVAIPVHDMIDKKFFLCRCLDSLWMQTFQDFEIVVTDNSEDDVIKEICEWYKTGIKYYKNPVKGMAQNTNEAIKRSEGELIKILYMDDHLAWEDSLEDLMKAFKGRWLITGVDNNNSPEWTDDIETGNNRLGSPSALTILNKEPLLFDEEMTWLLDCDYYRRMYDKYGKPEILFGTHVNMGEGPHQATHTMGEERKLQEAEYMNKKYEK